jgi:alpha-amylase
MRPVAASTSRRAGRAAAALVLMALAAAGWACARGSAATPAGAAAATAAPALSPLRPHAVAGGWLFSYRAPAGTRSVHLAGEFNGWSTSAWPMSDADGDQVWTITAPLETGRRYQYKFVVNGGEWVTDPNAEAVDPNNFNNGILTTRRPGEAYVVSLAPADGARLATFDAVTAVVAGEGHALRNASLVLTDWLGRRSWTLAATVDPAAGTVTAPGPPDLPDGDWLATLTVELEGAPPLVKTSGFSIDRWTGRVDGPPFWDRAVLYEAFVRSFADGPDDDDSGDLAGLTARLDYLNDGNPRTNDDLGIDAIWLMPVHPSPSYHGYDITDYTGIESDYGTLDVYRTFEAEAHRRGIRVVLDYVVNHSSNEHPFFLESLGQPGAAHAGWYKFLDKDNRRYQGFADIGAMPEFNFRSAAMRDYLLEVADFWMDLDGDGDFTDGVDGFRCDVAKGPPHDFWRQLRDHVKGRRADFLLLGEVWDNAATIAPYYHDEYDMNFDYPLYYATLELLDGRKSSAGWLGTLRELRATYPPGAQRVVFLDNHDNNRIGSILAGDVAKQKLATGLLFTLPGTPLVYYGMEVGMEGVKPDPDIRKPMRWDLVAAQSPDPSSLLSWHRNLVRLRRDLAALGAPDEPAAPTLHAGHADDPRVVAYLRRAAGGGAAALVVANPSGAAVTTRVAVPGDAGARSGDLRPRQASGARAPEGAADLNRGVSVALEPWGFGIWEVVGN